MRNICSGLLISSLLAIILVACGSGPTGTTPGTSSPTPTLQATVTTSGTATQTPVPTPTTGPYQPISKLWMVDTTTGWARTTTHLILHTSDGGNSWQNVTPALPVGNIVQETLSFTYLGGSMAWVAVSEKQQADGKFTAVLFRTSDGGQNWQTMNLPPDQFGVSQVQFINSQDGRVLASFGGGAAGSQAIDILSTTDGGQTWKLATHTQPGNTAGSLPATGSKSGMSWVTASTGWVAGSTAIPNTVWLYRTQDSGASWQQQALPLPSFSSYPAQATQPPIFFNANEGLLPVIFADAKSSSLALYATHDGGLNWTSSIQLSTAGSPWDFLTMQQGWVAAPNGTDLNETTDGGQHWTTITPSANFQHISQLDFVTAQVGWAISTATPDSPSLLKTMDGGHTWIQAA